MKFFSTKLHKKYEKNVGVGVKLNCYMENFQSLGQGEIVIFGLQKVH